MTDRIQVWKIAVQALLAIKGTTRVFELNDDGTVGPLVASGLGAVVGVAKCSPRRIPARRDTPDFVHQFPVEYSFWDFHVAIEDAVGWEDRHLHEFRLFDDGARQTVAIGIPTDMSPL